MPDRFPYPPKLFLTAMLRSLNALSALCERGDWGAVVSYLRGLSNAQFRAAGTALGEQIMPRMDDEAFYALASQLIAYHSRAFLVTVLKAIARRPKFIEHSGFEEICRMARGNEVEQQKITARLLPALSRPADVERLLALCGIEEPKERAAHLLKADTPAAAFALLGALRQLDHEADYLRLVVRHLMKRADDSSFNLASLLVTYFGLDDVKGTFARPIEPYQLARLASDYEAFRQALRR